MRVAVITVNDLSVCAEFSDVCSPVVASKLASAGMSVAVEKSVTREFESIARALRECTAHDAGVDVVITIGGTGLSQRDVTPEATLSVLDRPIPGIAEEIRRCGAASVPNAALSRGVAGLKHKTLVVNLPGTPEAVESGMDVVLPIISQVTSMLNS